MVRSALRGPIYGLLVLTTLVACTEQQFRLGFERDITPPQVAVVKTSGDTLDVSQGIVFAVNATDNLGLKTINITMTGGFLGTVDTTFTIAIKDIALGVNIPLPSNTTVGGTIVIQATAVDGNTNSATVTDSIFMVNLAALLVTVVQPATGQVTGPGVQMPVLIRATQSAGIRRVGYVAFGNVTGGDSASFPLPDTAFLDDTLLVPVTTAPGTFFVQGFAIDSANRRASSSVVTIQVQVAAVDSIPPIVNFTVAKRVEVGDSLVVDASDPSGITRIGWIARDTATGAIVAGDSVTFGTPVSPAQRRFFVSFPPAVLGQFVLISAFAVDAPGNRGEALVPGTTTAQVRTDTVLVVNGVTRALPFGGRVVDAVYNRNRNEVYFTNIVLGRLEVFRLGDTTFGPAGVLQGSQPWGVALWPRDTVTGAHADTVIVGNSGGTNFSIVNVNVPVGTPPREARRHPLPIYGVQTVKSVEIFPGVIVPEITEYSFDDRPQYLGAVCRGGDCTAAGGGDVLVVYSTTPTIGQSAPFPRRASVRYEKVSGAIQNAGPQRGYLVAPESHFFWEQSAAGSAAQEATDTLRVVVRHGNVETVRLDFTCAVITAILELGFLDTTFVRNSGNFARAFVGEGGRGTPALSFARAMSYDANAPVIATCASGDPLNEDTGISPALEVRNFITNTAAPVKSIATNYNGTTNLVRADSIYVLDLRLRLQGLVTAGGANFGIDMNFTHDFDAKVEASPTAVSPNERLVFSATPNAEIDVYDTYFYCKVATIPIRDPIIGPVRGARLPSGQQALVGVTARGVVLAVIPVIPNDPPCQ